MVQPRPVLFGEVLFDCFPDGKSVLGGAPFNVAWHLQSFSCAPLLISSVGNDEKGDLVRSIMQEKGMDVSGLQTSEQYPTGKVVVELKNGQPSYEIVTDQAYDHISVQAAKDALINKEQALIYHGSLALRNEASKSALDAILQETNLPVFLDVNLRDPWWDLPLLENILRQATWVKINDEELCEIIRRPLEAGPLLRLYAQELFDAYQWERLIVTLGDKGAFVISGDGIVEGPPVLVTNIVDTVGAGDAFSAVTIAGILQGDDISQSLNKALAYAAKICQQQGATG